MSAYGWEYEQDFLFCQYRSALTPRPWKCLHYSAPAHEAEHWEQPIKPGSELRVTSTRAHRSNPFHRSPGGRQHKRRKAERRGNNRSKKK